MNKKSLLIAKVLGEEFCTTKIDVAFSAFPLRNRTEALWSVVLLVAAGRSVLWQCTIETEQSVRAFSLSQFEPNRPTRHN